MCYHCEVSQSVRVDSEDDESPGRVANQVKTGVKSEVEEEGEPAITLQELDDADYAHSVALEDLEEAKAEEQKHLKRQAEAQRTMDDATVSLEAVRQRIPGLRRREARLQLAAAKLAVKYYDAENPDN